MLFIGHTRFSLFNPKSSSWRATNGRFATPEEYEAYLYSDERLTIRCKIFLEQSLPQLEAASKDHDLLHVVSYSGNLPAKFQQLLEDAADRFSFLVLDRHSEGRRPTDIDALARERLGGAGAFATYRLDDDDLLTVDYFNQVAPYVRPENAGMQVSLASGLTALYADGKYSNIRETYWPMLAIGLLSICRFDTDGSLVKPAHAPHHLSDRTNPVILDSRKTSYLWVRHVDQDTAMDFNPDEARAKLVASMSRFPAVNEYVDLANLFPVLAKNIRAPKREGLLSTPTDVVGEIRFSLATPANAFSLKIDALLGDDAVSSNALISLDLTDAAERPLAEAQIARLSAFGIATSSNPAVGPYRYLNTPPGRSLESYEFALPDGVLCRGFRLRRWKKADTAIRLHSIDAYVS